MQGVLPHLLDVSVHRNIVLLMHSQIDRHNIVAVHNVVLIEVNRVKINWLIDNRVAIGFLFLGCPIVIVVPQLVLCSVIEAGTITERTNVLVILFLLHFACLFLERAHLDLRVLLRLTRLRHLHRLHFLATKVHRINRVDVVDHRCSIPCIDCQWNVEFVRFTKFAG